MNDVSVDLLTRIPLACCRDPLARIWSLDVWASSVAGVRALRILENAPDYQLFEMTFDAGRPKPDCVKVERRRSADAIHVRHIRPPPGLEALSGRWWRPADPGDVLYVRRSMLIAADRYDAATPARMFRLLRESLVSLVGASA